MNRCTVIDLLEDKYGLNKDELSKRELAIIGLCTNELADDEEQELNLHFVSKPLLTCKCGNETQDLNNGLCYPCWNEEYEAKIETERVDGSKYLN